MKSVIVLVLINCLWLPALVLPAPTPDQRQTFMKEVEQTRMMVNLVLEQLPAARSAALSLPGLTHDCSSHSMDVIMDLPDPPVIKMVSGTVTLDMCVSNMSAGIQLFQDLVLVLSGKVSGLETQKNLLRDLKLRIEKMKEAGHLSGAEGTVQNPELSSRLDDYNVQVAVCLTLAKLESFCHDMSRSLRKMESNKLP